MLKLYSILDVLLVYLPLFLHDLTGAMLCHRFNSLSDLFIDNDSFTFSVYFFSKDLDIKTFEH